MCIVLIFQCDLMLCVAVSPFEQANIHLWWQQQMISNGGEITFLSALGKVCKNLFLQHTYDICPSSAIWCISFFQLIFIYFSVLDLNQHYSLIHDFKGKVHVISAILVYVCGTVESCCLIAVKDRCWLKTWFIK